MRKGLLGLLALASCGGDDAGVPPDAGETCVVGGEFDPEAPACSRLSSYGLFEGNGASQEPVAGVVPYDLTSPLFSDYSTKHRFIRLPAGQAATWSDDGVLEFPVGTVIIKTFSYLADLGDPTSAERLLETRLLVRRSDGWEGLVYQWNDEQTEALLSFGGDTVPVSWTHTDGATRELDYIIPNPNKCKNCHENAEVVAPIGPKARYLNKDSQLADMIAAGMIDGAPADLGAVPTVPAFDDETAELNERARGWLEINCAHCHNPAGAAGSSGLDLRFSQLDPYKFGVCKTPVAAGAGSGGFQFGIVPGNPDESIMVFRISSTEPDIRMPEILHQMVHDEGVALIRAWIAAMTGTCEAPAP